MRGPFPDFHTAISVFSLQLLQPLPHIQKEFLNSGCKFTVERSIPRSLRAKSRQTVKNLLSLMHWETGGEGVITIMQNNRGKIKLKNLGVAREMYIFFHLKFRQGSP